MFTKLDVPFFRKGLSATQADEWVRVANNALEERISAGEDELDAEIGAIRKANAMFGGAERGTMLSEHFRDGKEMQLTLGEVESAEDGRWNLVLPIGIAYTDYYGDLIITRTFVERLLANQAVLKNTKPFLDTEHDRGAANAWMADMRAGELGLEVKWDWTDRGRELVAKRLYKYFSAHLRAQTDIESGEVVFPTFVGCALTNSPVMKQLPEAALSDKGIPPAHGDRDKPQEGKRMEFAEVLKAVSGLTSEQKLFVAKELGLAEPARQITELSEKTRKLEGEKAVLEETNKALSDEVEKSRADAHAAKRKEAIEAALSDGRILPKDREKWEKRFDENAEFAAKVLADLPKAISYDTSGTSSTGGNVALSDDDREAMRLLGMDEKTYRKYAGLEG